MRGCDLWTFDAENKISRKDSFWKIRQPRGGTNAALSDLVRCPCDEDHIPAEGIRPWPTRRSRWSRTPSTPGCGCSVPGWQARRRASWPSDGTVSDGSYPEAIGGFCVVEVPSRAEALEWAARIAVAAVVLRRSGSSCPTRGLDRGRTGVVRPESSVRARRVLDAGERPVRFEPPVTARQSGVSSCAWLSRTQDSAQASWSLSRNG